MSSLGLSKKATENPIKTNFGGLPCVIKLYLIALSIYYQVIVFIHSPTRMRVFEKPKTFLIFDTKARKWILLFFYRKFKFCLITADLNILVLIKEIFCSANNYVKLIFTLKIRAALLRIKNVNFMQFHHRILISFFLLFLRNNKKKVLITVLRTDERDHGF